MLWPRHLHSLLLASKDFHYLRNSHPVSTRLEASLAWGRLHARMKLLRASRASVPNLRIECHLAAELAQSVAELFESVFLDYVPPARMWWGHPLGALTPEQNTVTSKAE